MSQEDKTESLEQNVLSTDTADAAAAPENTQVTDTPEETAGVFSGSESSLGGSEYVGSFDDFLQPSLQVRLEFP